VALVAILLVVRWCSQSFGNVITLPGGLGKESTGGTGSSDGTGGGWFSPKEQNSGTTASPDLEREAKELEREMGIGTNKGTNTTTNTQSTNPYSIPSTTPSSTSTTPLSFKGIPMTGSLSSFGSELVKAGFRNAGSGVYTGDFAGYSGCKVTPSGSNPVHEVRVDFPVISDWDALEKSYDNLQASLTRKYGIEPVTSTNNNIAVYNLPNGTITLDADVANQSTWHVILKYTNALSVNSTGSLQKDPYDDL